MHLVKRKDSPEKMGWRCPRKNCRKDITLRRGTYFEGKLIGLTVSNIIGCCCIYVGSDLEIQVILRLLHLWPTKTPVGKAQDELQVSTQ